MKEYLEIKKVDYNKRVIIFSLPDISYICLNFWHFESLNGTISHGIIEQYSLNVDFSLSEDTNITSK